MLSRMSHSTNKQYRDTRESERDSWKKEEAKALKVIQWCGNEDTTQDFYKDKRVFSLTILTVICFTIVCSIMCDVSVIPIS